MSDKYEDILVGPMTDFDAAKKRLEEGHPVGRHASCGILGHYYDPCDIRLLLSDHDRLTRELREAQSELHRTHALMLTYKERNIECAGGHDGLGCGPECATEKDDLRARLAQVNADSTPSEGMRGFVELGKGSEQPDLPLEHEFEPCPSLMPDGFPARFCVLTSPTQTECHFWQLHPARYCGLPESAHGRKP